MKNIPEADPQLWEEFKVTGDPEIREFLILYYQPFVLACAKSIGRSVGWIVPLQEMVANGQVGLLKAVRGYDPDRGGFKKYASTYIWGAIIDAMRAADWLPRQYRLAQKEIQAATIALGGTPTPREVAEHMGWSEDDVREALMHVHRSDVIAMPEMALSIPSQQGTDGRDLLLAVLAAFERLSKDQQLIIALRYYGKLSLADISLVMPGVAVSDEHAQALVAVYDEVYQTAL